MGVENLEHTAFHDDVINDAYALAEIIRVHIDQMAENKLDLLKIWPLLVKEDFHRMLIEQRHGGLGLDLKQYIHVIRVLANVDGALALAVHVHNYAVKITSELGDEYLIRRMRSFLDEGCIFSLARSEYGRDYRYNFSTIILNGDSGKKLHGQKDFVTLAGLSDYYIVFAQTEAEQVSMDSLQVCIVNAKDPAVKVIKTNGFDSMVASCTYSVQFNHYELVETDFIGKPGGITTLTNPDTLTLGICAINLGMAEQGIKLFVEKERQLYQDKQHPIEILAWIGQMDVFLRSTELLIEESIQSRPHLCVNAGVCLRRSKAASDTLINKVTQGAIKYLGIEAIMSKNDFIYLTNNSYATRILPPNTQKSLVSLGMERVKD
jgi:alkylation response protein AidB-like acyl-CoA dehydrogenase